MGKPKPTPQMYHTRHQNLKQMNRVAQRVRNPRAYQQDMKQIAMHVFIMQISHFLRKTVSLHTKLIQNLLELASRLVISYCKSYMQNRANFHLHLKASNCRVMQKD